MNLISLTFFFAGSNKEKIKHLRGKNRAMAYKIFISFTAKDQDVANSLKRQLMKAGAEVSEAEPHVEGSEIKLHIADALRQSDEVIAIVSKNSARSQWLNFEVGMAAGLGKKLLPVIVGMTASELPPVLRSFQPVHVDKFPRYVAKLSDRLRNDT
jgi:hypothetical protein